MASDEHSDDWDEPSQDVRASAGSLAEARDRRQESAYSLITGED